MTHWRAVRETEVPPEPRAVAESPKTMALSWPPPVAPARPNQPGTQQLNLSDPEALRVGLGIGPSQPASVRPVAPSGSHLPIERAFPSEPPPRPRDTQTGVEHEAVKPDGLPFRRSEQPGPGGYAYTSIPPSSPPPSDLPVVASGYPSVPPPSSAPPPTSSTRRPSRAWGTAWSMGGGQTIGQYLQSNKQTPAQSTDRFVPAALAAIPPPPMDAPQPVQQGAVAASDAAADRPSLRPSSQVFRAMVTNGSSEVPDLLWFDPKAVSRVRVWHKELLEDQGSVAFDERMVLSAESPQDFKVRSQILAVLTQSQLERGELEPLFHEGRAPTGHYVAPLVTLEGVLTFGFSELEELRVLVGQAEDHRNQNTDLGHAIDEVKRLVESPSTSAVTRTLARGSRFLRGKIRSLLGSEATRRLESDVEAILLEGRSYKKRTFLGGEWLRTSIARSSDEAVTYLPASLADELPLFARMRSRVVAEIIPAQDHFETSPFALRVVALARLLPCSSLASSMPIDERVES